MWRRSAIFFACAVVLSGRAAVAGPRLGGPLPGLTAAELAQFADGRAVFRRVETAATGLGPVFNDVSCAHCHGRPAVGGGSKIVETRFGTISGQSFDPLTMFGGLTLQSQGIGPTGSCIFTGEVIPPQATIIGSRRTTPVFGFGLVNGVPDASLLAIAASQQTTSPGTAGRPNMVTDVPTGQTRVGRFGWKAHVATLYHFSGEAYVNEMGITNHLFPAELCPQGDCAILACDPVGDPEDVGGDVERLRDFMNLLAPPPARPLSPGALRGEALFTSLGCTNCHVPTLQTGPHTVAALDRATFHPYSDFLLHDMGALGDGIVQGQATGREMRTAPLWGLRRQPRAFLHDGRARSFEEAILAHDGQGRAARDAFAVLTGQERRALKAFLRSL